MSVQPRGCRYPASRFRRSWVKLRRNKAALVGAVLILIYVLECALLAPVLFSGSPSAPNLINSLETPTLKNPLGYR